MLEVGGRAILAAVLVAASVAKLASPRSSSAALATFGVHGPRERWIAWGALIATELALATGVGAGLDLAAYLAAGLMASFGAAMLFVLRRGRARRSVCVLRRPLDRRLAGGGAQSRAVVRVRGAAAASRGRAEHNRREREARIQICLSGRPCGDG